ncbi:MAG: hypothetical protein AAF249_12900 [Pseudomonadota bacterium]
MFNYLRDLKGRQSEKWKEAQEAGLEEPTQPWPHPEDIILNEAGDEFWIRGPINAETVPAWEDLRRIRDLFLIELVLAITNDEKQIAERLWLVSMANEDLSLQKRWQITHDLGPAMDPLASMRQSRLRQLAEQERAWLRARAPDTPRTKEQYRDANRIFGPLVKALGYKSLKHFERELDI